MLSTMLGRLHHVVLNCRAPAAVAAFYSKLLGQPITNARANHNRHRWVRCRAVEGCPSVWYDPPHNG